MVGYRKLSRVILSLLLSIFSLTAHGMFRITNRPLNAMMRQNLLAKAGYNNFQRMGLAPFSSGPNNLKQKNFNNSRFNKWRVASGAFACGGAIGLFGAGYYCHIKKLDYEAEQELKIFMQALKEYTKELEKRRQDN